MTGSKAGSTAPSVTSEEAVDVQATPLSLARAVYARRPEYTRSHRLRIKVGSWNVAGCPGTDKDLAKWFVEGEGIDTDFANLNLCSRDAVELGQGSEETVRAMGGDKIGLYVLGLQEVVDLNMTKEYMNRAVNADSSPMAKWKTAMETAVPPGYELVAMEQMTGLLLVIFASPEIAPTITNVSTKAVGTGLFGYFGNKGAVSTRIMLGETTRMVFVNSHLASGASSNFLERRCWDVGQILSKTQFDPVVNAGVAEEEGENIGEEDFAFWFGDLNFRLDGLPADDIRRILTLHTQGEYGLASGEQAPPIEGEGVLISKGADSDDESSTLPSSRSSNRSFESDTTLPDPDEFPEDPSQDPTSLQATLDSLLPHDQLRRMMKERKVFHDGWKEGPITFLPSYKYDVGTVGLFDSSEKQRAPSWCDRILYRTRTDKTLYEQKVREERKSKEKDEEMKSRGIDQDDDVLFNYNPETDGVESAESSSSLAYDEYDEYNEYEDQAPEDGQQVVTKEGFKEKIRQDLYTSHQRISSSDHKPLVCIFTLDYDAIVPDLKALVHAEVARQLDRAENEGRPGITVVVDSGNDSADGVADFGEIAFLQRKSCSVTIANTSGVSATFSFVSKIATDPELDTQGADGSPPSGGPAGQPRWIQTAFVRPSHEPGALNDGDDVAALGDSVTLEPGETILAIVHAQVYEAASVALLNNDSIKLEDIMILRVEHGRDHFVPVRATWQPTCFGRSVEELIRVPEGGIRKYVRAKGIKGSIPYDQDVHCSAPKELFKLTDALQTLSERCKADEAMLEDMEIPREAGWPLDASTWTVAPCLRQDLQAAVVAALDTDGDIVNALPLELVSTQKLEVIASILVLFLESLVGGVFPPHLWAKFTTTMPNLPSQPTSSWPDVKTQILDILSAAPHHNIAFVFLTATLSRMAGELSFVAPNVAAEQRKSLTRRMSFRKGDDGLKRRRAREKRYAEIVGPLACRGGQGEAPGSKERQRLVIEIFLSREGEP